MTNLLNTLRNENGEPASVWPHVLILLCAYLLITSWNLSLQSIANPDEPRYAAPAREMLRGGDPWVPHFNGQSRLLKPIFFYWLIAATGAVGQTLGVGLATAFRWGPLLMGAFTVLGTFLLGRRLFGYRCGFFAAVLLMTTRLFHETARDLVVDMTLCAFLLWAWLFCHIALERIEKQLGATLPLLGFYLCLGLAALTKWPSPVALFVVIPLLVFLLWTRRLKNLKNAGLWWGIPFALAVASIWFVVAQLKGEDVLSAFKTENLDHAAGTKDHQRYMPFLDYILWLGDGFAPWSLLIPISAWWTYQLVRRKEKQPDEIKFLICCLGMPFFLLGIIITKRALYLMPLYPFFALWVAWVWEMAFLKDEGIRPNKMILLAPVGGALAITAFLIGADIYFQKQDWMQTSELLLLFILGTGLLVACFALRRSLLHGLRYKASLQLLAMAAALCIGYEAIARPMRERRENREPFYRKVCEQLHQRPVVLWELSSNEAVWYLDRPHQRIDDLTRPQLKERFFDVPGMIMLANLNKLSRDQNLDLKKTLLMGAPREELKRNGESYVLAVPDPQHPPDPAIFKPRVKGKKNALSEGGASP